MDFEMNTIAFENIFNNLPALSVSGSAVVSIIAAVAAIIIIISIIISVIIITPPGMV